MVFCVKTCVNGSVESRYVHYTITWRTVPNHKLNTHRCILVYQKQKKQMKLFFKVLHTNLEELNIRLTYTQHMRSCTLCYGTLLLIWRVHHMLMLYIRFEIQNVWVKYRTKWVSSLCLRQKAHYCLCCCWCCCCCPDLITIKPSFIFKTYGHHSQRVVNSLDLYLTCLYL